jgi:hypothetical protein
VITAASFRQDYSEFASVSLYPNSGVNYWIQVAALLLRVQRWGNGSAAPAVPASTMYDVASELFVAHNLAIEKQAQDAARRGGTPGVSTGPVTSKSVGPVSIGYASSEALEADGGYWNLTTYGTRLLRLMGYFGAGPVQVGPCCDGEIGGGWFCGGLSPEAFVPPVGTIAFTLNPAPGTGVTLGETTVMFVAGAATGDEVTVGATLGATMIALEQLLATSDDDSISACNYALTSSGPAQFVLNIAYKELGPTGNTFVIATTVRGSVASGPTLVGPIVTNNNGFGNSPWIGPDPWPGESSFG